jgi:cellulose synthase (UDP-forming)
VQRFQIALIVAGLLALNVLLQINFNTLLWPYLWPRPAIFVIMGLVVFALWFREHVTGAGALRVIGLLMVFIGQSYLVHGIAATIAAPSLVALLHIVGFTGTFLVMVLSYINQFAPRDRKIAPAIPDDLPTVAAVVPTYGEPAEILERTLQHLTALDYPAARLYILVSDDGHRDEIRALAERYGAHYSRGARKDAKAGNLNAALKYLEQHCPQATLILTQDADELIHPSFLKKTVGYFSDPKIGFVQTPKDAFTPPGDPFGNRDRVFYDVIQPGRNGSGAAFSCGSGVVWSIAALRSIGGFATWNIVEDMTTSYFLHAAGWRSEYHNEILTIGLSPDDIPGLLKQRGTWAADTWRFFLFNNPLTKPGLTIRQRLQYFELGMFYVSTVFFIPLLMLTPVLSLMTRTFVPIEGSALFPWVLASTLYYLTLARGNLSFALRMWQYWVGHWPTYTKAFFLALGSRMQKPTYKVTRKTRQTGFYGHLIWQQYAYVLVGAALTIYALVGLPEVNLFNRLANVGVLLFYMVMLSGICRASWYGVTWQVLAETIQDLVGRLRPAPRPSPAPRMIAREQAIIEITPSAPAQTVLRSDAVGSAPGQD